MYDSVVILGGLACSVANIILLLAFSQSYALAQVQKVRAFTLPFMDIAHCIDIDSDRHVGLPIGAKARSA